MAVTAIAVGASYAGAAVATYAFGAAASATFAYIATSAVVSIGISTLAGKAFGVGQGHDASDFAGDIASGMLVNKQSNNAPIPVVYGQRKIGGTRVFIEATGDNNDYLHVVLAVSEGEVNSFENIYLNDIISTDERFDDVLDLYTHTGADNQTADSNLVSDVNNWTTDHKLQGTAYIYAKLKFDQDAYPQGLPTITAG